MIKKIAIPVIIFVLILVAGIFLLGRKPAKPQEEETFIPTPTVVLPTVSSEVNVELIPSSGNRSVTLKISNLPKGTESVEYELTYITGSGLPRGVLGKIDVNGKSEIERSDITLGTCSSGKCVYDTGVESIDLSLKFSSKEGESVYRNTFPL